MRDLKKQSEVLANEGLKYQGMQNCWKFQEIRDKLIDLQKQSKELMENQAYKKLSDLKGLIKQIASKVTKGKYNDKAINLNAKTNVQTRPDNSMDMSEATDALKKMQESVFEN